MSAGDWRERCLKAEQENARLTAIAERLFGHEHYELRDAVDDVRFLLAHVETLTQQVEQAEQQRDAAHAALADAKHQLRYFKDLLPAPAQETERGC